MSLLFSTMRHQFVLNLFPGPCYLISNFGIASMLNCATKLKFMLLFNMEATPKSDIKSINKSDIRFDDYMDQALG